MRYDIEADWQLLNTCNYRCDYCFFGPELLGEKLTVRAEPQTWSRAIDRTGLTWLLHITGGEPSIYPRFAELCRLLTANHFISFNSNLSYPSVLEIADTVEPSRVSFINAGLHAEERERKKGLAAFLKHAEALRRRDFKVFITIVGTPQVLSRPEEIIDLTATIGMMPIPKLLRGPYKGRVYPASYSAEEKAAFTAFASKARQSYETLFDSDERPSIDVFGDEQYLGSIPNFRGRMCTAGERFVSVDTDGTVYRCETKLSNYLGNVLDGSFRPKKAGSPCNSAYCFYFYLKYADAPRLDGTDYPDAQASPDGWLGSA